MIEFFIGMFAVMVAVAAMVVALDAHLRIGDHEADDARRDARIADLGRQVHALRMRQVPEVNRLPVTWWQDELEHDIQQAS